MGSVLAAHRDVGKVVQNILFQLSSSTITTGSVTMTLSSQLTLIDRSMPCIHALNVCMCTSVVCEIGNGETGRQTVSRSDSQPDRQAEI